MQLHFQPSTYISAGGHALLLGFALFGGLFSAEPLEFPTVNVTTISSEEFAALTAAPEPPAVDQDVPVLAVPEPEPDVIPQPAPEPEPVPTPTPAPQPEPPAPEPAPPAPEPVPEPEPVPPAPAEDVVVIPDVAPDSSSRPVPRPADRVASEAVEAPDPDAEIDNTAQEATTPDETAEVQTEEQQEAAPEEATTEIVTEAEQPAASAPSQTVRPQSRPRPTQTVSRPQTDDADTSTQDAVNAALAEALGEPDADAAPGASLSDEEIGGFKLAVQGCWDVDVGSRSADVTVVISMSMNPNGTVQQGSIKLESFSGGEGSAVDTAYLRARRAVYECQREGYDLPEDRYDLWREVEITFNPKDMRIR